jgi:hypothetical protein
MGALRESVFHFVWEWQQTVALPNANKNTEEGRRRSIVFIPALHVNFRKNGACAFFPSAFDPVYVERTGRVEGIKEAT